ncbi:MAG TPA: hypothetical protein VKQ30_26040, partial [Ktedonobacterales bacterium]|nr:hypothetical protein [Ktedonobacterales bacterium]
VVLSPSSISSGWVQREIDAAIHLRDQQPQRIILPVVARSCEVPLLLVGFRYLSGPHNAGLEPDDTAQRVLRALDIATISAPSSFQAEGAVVDAAQRRTLSAPRLSSSARRHRLPYIAFAAAIIVVSLGVIGHLATSGSSNNYPQPTHTTASAFTWSGRGASVSMISSTEGWAVGTGTLLHYHNGAWSTLPTPNSSDSLLGVYMLPTGDGWAVGNYGVILREVGGQWTPVQGVAGLGTEDALDSVFMVSSDEGWTVGDVVAHYSGGQWNIANVPNHAFLRSVFMVSSDEGWAVGDTGAMLHYQRGRWTAPARITSANLNSVYMSSSSEGWAVGAGVLLHYSHAVWTVQRFLPAVESPFNSVFMLSSAQGWATGDNGAIWQYNDGVWVAAKSPVKANLYGEDMLSSNNGWAVGASGAILHFDGTTWSTYHPPA